MQASFDGFTQHLSTLVDEVSAVREEALSQLKRGDLTPPAPVAVLPDQRVHGPEAVSQRLRAHIQLEVFTAAAEAAAWERVRFDGDRQQMELLQAMARRLRALHVRSEEAITAAVYMVEGAVLQKLIFKVDHLHTRMQRVTESLSVLSGESRFGAMSEPILVASVLRFAAQEIEQYSRIQVTVPADEQLALPGYMAGDVIHLLAELMENGAQFSPSTTRVQVRTEQVSHGLLINVENEGPSIEPRLLERLNVQLAEPKSATMRGKLLNDGRLGVVVAGELARILNVAVRLSNRTMKPGTVAQLFIPQERLTRLAIPTFQPPQGAHGEWSISAPQPGLQRVPASRPPQHLASGLPMRGVHDASPPADDALPVASASPAFTSERPPLPHRPPEEALPVAAPDTTHASPTSGTGPTPELIAQFTNGARAAAEGRPLTGQ
ncbi:ATP-binding protein [Streptomyces sp. NPDC020883]|uniref:ATP-binding protein n=1 Tax=Streptomyces sp. NPDC020883 TaxID=3365099 RepID=UPI00379554C0